MCVSTRHFAAALPILAHPITTIDTSISDLNYNDNLVYHYAGGMAYAGLKRWAEAREFFEICACSPGSTAAAIQMEALKKLVLVQLIHEGKVGPATPLDGCELSLTFCDRRRHRQSIFIRRCLDFSRARRIRRL